MPKKYWSGKVTKRDNPRGITPGIFTSSSPTTIARSLKRSAAKSKYPLRSALAKLDFYVNRAGNNLSSARKKVLSRTKTSLHHLFSK